MTHGLRGRHPWRKPYTDLSTGTVFGHCTCTHNIKLLHNCTCKQTAHTAVTALLHRHSATTYEPVTVALRHFQLLWKVCTIGFTRDSPTSMNLNVNVNLELRQSHAQLHMHHRLTRYIIITTIYAQP